MSCFCTSSKLIPSFVPNGRTMNAFIIAGASSNERTKMRRVNRLAGCSPDFDQRRDVLDGIHLLDTGWIDVAKSKATKTVSAQIGIVSRIEKVASKIG